MKKNQALFTIGCGALCLLLAACGSKNDNPTQTLASQSTSSASLSEQPDEAPLTERLHNPEIKFIQDAGDKFTASIGYPQFGIDELDQTIASYVRQTVSDFAMEAEETEQASVSLPDASEETDLAENEEASNASLNEVTETDTASASHANMDEIRSMNPFVLSGDNQVFLCNDRYVSVLITSSADLQGDQPFIRQSTFVYDTQDETMMTLDDVFKPDSDYQTLLQNTCVHILSSLNPHFDSEKLAEGTTPTDENYAHFALSDTHLSIFFDPGQVADESEGTNIVEIPYAHLRDILVVDVPAESLDGDPLSLEIATNSEDENTENDVSSSADDDALEYSLSEEVDSEEDFSEEDISGGDLLDDVPEENFPED